MSRVFLTALVFFAAATAWARPWTDRTGRVIEAKFVRLNGDSVVLLQGAKVVTWPLADLCDSDQDYVRQQVAPKPKPKDGEKTPAGPATKPAETEPKPEAPATPQLADGERLWTDIRGKQLAAKFVRVDNGQVYLTHNGIEKSYPIVGFSDEDRKLIATLAPPPPPPPPPSMPSPMPSPSPHFPQPNIARIPERPSMPSFPERPPMPTVTHTPPPTPHFEPPRPSPPPPVTMPTYTPPSPPRPTIPSQFSSNQGSDKFCSKCNKPAPANAKAGDTCKHCGTVWGYEEDEKGNVVGYSSGYMAGKIAGGVIAVIVILSALLRAFNR